MTTNTAADRYRTPKIERWTAVGLILLSFLGFLLSRPYIGIMQDARLYVGFALAQLEPNGIGQDLLFTADGQSGYSIYPAILRELVRAVGPSKAAMLSAFCGLCVWFAVFYRFSKSWWGDQLAPPRATAAILLALSVSHSYGGTGVFKFAEPYATPRIFAEALVLLGLTSMLSGSSVVMIFGPVLFAAVIHPIMAAPALAVGLLWLARRPHQQVTLAALVAVGGGLLLCSGPLLGVDRVPFARFDPEWRQALDAKRALVFLRWWRPQDFTRTLLQFVTVALAASTLGPAHRRLISACVITAGAGLAITAIGADVVGNVLLTQAQLWRALWIVSLLASISLPILVHDAWRRESNRDVIAGSKLRQSATLVLILAWIVVEYSTSAGVLAALAAVLWCAPMYRPDLTLPPSGIPLITAVVAGLALFMVGAQAWITTEFVLGAPDTLPPTTWNYVWMTAVPGLLTLLVAVWIFVSGAEPRPRVVGVVAGALLVLVVVAWDSRTTYQRQLERRLDSQAVNREPQPVSARPGPVFWPFSDLEAWAYLGRPSWGTQLQGIPAVFNRELALVWTSRWRRLRASGLTPTAEGAQELVVGAYQWGGDASLRRLCNGSDSPELVILPSTLPLDVKTVLLEMAEPKLLQPATRGANWKRIDKWQLIRCADVTSVR